MPTRLEHGPREAWNKLAGWTGYNTPAKHHRPGLLFFRTQVCWMNAPWIKTAGVRAGLVRLWQAWRKPPRCPQRMRSDPAERTAECPPPGKRYGRANRSAVIPADVSAR
jgi:hypothetical protein